MTRLIYISCMDPASRSPWGALGCPTRNVCRPRRCVSFRCQMESEQQDTSNSESFVRSCSRTVVQNSAGILAVTLKRAWSQIDHSELYI